MKKDNVFLLIIAGLSVMLLFSSCEDLFKKKATVTFGSNFHIVNCLSTVTVYLDGKNIGTLKHGVDTIYDCGEEENITKEIKAGHHAYKIRFSSESGGCADKELTGVFTVAENECEKVFIDFRTLFDKEPECGDAVIISSTEFETAPSALLHIDNLKIEGDCLTIRFSSSGCSGGTWITKLIDAGRVAESDPCQRTLRLSLENREMCEAYITKEVSFNIKKLQINGDNKVLLNISDKQILYEY